MTPADLIRDAKARMAAKEQYERRAAELFELEDDIRTIGSHSLARSIHRDAVVAGHAAWAELVDPEPRGLD